MEPYHHSGMPILCHAITVATVPQSKEQRAPPALRINLKSLPPSLSLPCCEGILLVLVSADVWPVVSSNLRPLPHLSSALQ
eukprot:scaffold128649_cov17-Tisochrysis_lutea.AAC.1